MHLVELIAVELKERLPVLVFSRTCLPQQVVFPPFGENQ